MATNDLLSDEASLSKTSTIPQVNPPTILQTRQKNVSDFDKLKEKSENNLDDQNNGTKIFTIDVIITLPMLDDYQK